MAIAFDNVSPDTSSAGNVSSLTSGNWTISGSDRCLFGFIGTGTGGSATTHSGMKWGGSGGTALTQIGSTVNAGSPGRLSAWRLTAPAAASQALYGNWAAAQDESAIGGVSYTGVDQAAPVGAPATNTGSILGAANGNMTVTIATAVGDVVLAAFWVVCFSAADPQLTPGGTPAGTGRYEVEGASLSYEAMQVQEVVATGTSTTVTCGFSSGAAFSGEWAAIAFVVNPSSAAATEIDQQGQIALQGALSIAGDLAFEVNIPVAAASPIALVGDLGIAGDLAFQIKRWRVPTSAPQGTSVHVMVFSGASPTYALLAQGVATVDASGFADIPATGTIGTEAFAFVHNYDDDTNTVSIYGGAGIATLVDVG